MKKPKPLNKKPTKQQQTPHLLLQKNLEAILSDMPWG